MIVFADMIFVQGPFVLEPLDDHEPRTRSFVESSLTLQESSGRARRVLDSGGDGVLRNGQFLHG